jgi:5-methylcytosine-specific restriction endonuclease McrA
MSVYEYFSRSLRILNYKIREDGDEAITWIDGIDSRGFDFGVDKQKRQDIFVIPVAYLTDFLSCDGDYTEFFEKLLKRADFSKEYMHELWIKQQEDIDAEERKREREHEVWCENRDAKYSLLGLHNIVCAYCGNDLYNEYSELDHVIPRSKGGTNSPENLVVSCMECNRKKHSKTPEEANMPIRYGDCNLLREGGL